MLNKISATPLAQWTQGQPLTVCYNWARNAGYTDGVPVGYGTVS